MGISAWIVSPFASICVLSQPNYSAVLASSAIRVIGCPIWSPQDELTVVLFPNSFCHVVISTVPIPISRQTLCMCIFKQTKVFCQAVNLHQVTPIQLTLSVSITPCLFVLGEEISAIAGFHPGRRKFSGARSTRCQRKYE